MEEHILVGLSSALSNTRIIRTAATMAAAFGCSFTALFVRTPSYDAMSDADKARLRTNARLAALDNSGGESFFRNGNLSIDYGAGCAYLGNAALKLTPAEYKLLCLLTHDVGELLGKRYGIPPGTYGNTP